MVGKPGSMFPGQLDGEMDQRMARRYAKRIRAAHPRWDVRVVKIAEGLNHIQIDRPAEGITQTWILRTPAQCEECLT